MSENHISPVLGIFMVSDQRRKERKKRLKDHTKEGRSKLNKWRKQERKTIMKKRKTGKEEKIDLTDISNVNVQTNYQISVTE